MGEQSRAPRFSSLVGADRCAVIEPRLELAGSMSDEMTRPDVTKCYERCPNSEIIAATDDRD